jgi:hypothetical protein
LVATFGHRFDESAVRQETEVPADRVRVEVESRGKLLGVEAATRGAQELEDHLPLLLTVHGLILPRTYHDEIRRKHGFASGGLLIR